MAFFHFIKSLTPQEIKVISPAFPLKKDVKKSIHNSQEAEIFNLVLCTPLSELNDSYVLSKMKEQPSASAYSKLKSQILFKVLDKISSDKFIRNDDIVKGTERAEIRVKKKLLQIKILHVKTSRSEQKIFLQLLNEVIEEAKEYELYDNLIEALSYKKYYYAVRSGYADFNKINEEIGFYRSCSAALSEANDFYFEIIANQKLISHFSEKEIESYIDEKVQYLESSSYTTVSKYIQYYYKILKLAQQQKDKKNNESVDTCLEIISLLNRSKALARTERYGFVYTNLSQCLILQREFKQAAQTARTAAIYFPQESLSFVLVAEQEFFASLYGGDFERCRQLIFMMLNHNKRDTGQVRQDIFTYYQGCLEFMEGNFKEAKQVTNQSLTILKDKPRWDLGMRYLKIMSLVELKYFEEAIYAIEALRKQIKRTKEEGKIEITQRDQLIYRAFNEYARCEFSTLSNSLDYYLKRLGNKETAFSWKFFTHEVIPVHKWMKKRLGATSTAKQRLSSRTASTGLGKASLKVK
jgi:hypothetical protein